MTGVRLFLDKLRRQPGRALWDLAVDYATYVGMCHMRCMRARTID